MPIDKFLNIVKNNPYPMAAKKKPTAKQLAARRKFAKMAKSGQLAKMRKKSKSNTKRKSIPKSEQNRLRRARNQGRSVSDRAMVDKLLLAIKDPNIKEIVIKK